MSYRKVEFNNLNDEFGDISSDFLNSDTPTTNDLERVLDAYNAIISYSEIDWDRKKRSTKEFITSTIGVNRITVQRCFEKLNLPVVLPGKLLSTIHYLPPVPKQSDTSSESNDSNNPNNTSNENNPNNNSNQNDSNSGVNQNVSNNSTNNNLNPNNSNDNQNNHSNQTIQNTMAQTVENYLKSAAHILNYKYGGDPLKLNSFIIDAQLVESLATNDDTKKFCLTFIKSRLEGRAEEAIPDDCKTVEALTTALKAKIKPDNSGIIEGKMTALSLRKNDYSKFAAEAEKLAEALRRTLIIEGLTRAKAEEMTIKKTVEICRKTAKSEVVKSVLSSRKYDTPADVIATFITQSDIARREYKEAQATQKKTNSGGNGNGKQGKSYNKNRNSNNGQNNRTDNRGNYRGNNRGRSQNQQQNRDRNNGNNRSSRNEHTIRLVTGAQAAQTAEPSAPQQDQFFRIEN